MKNTTFLAIFVVSTLLACRCRVTGHGESRENPKPAAEVQNDQPKETEKSVCIRVCDIRGEACLRSHTWDYCMVKQKPCYEECGGIDD